MVAPLLTDTSCDARDVFNAFSTPMLQIADYDVAGATAAEACSKWSTPPSLELTLEVDGAQRWLGVAVDELLLAALGRTVARTIGDGTLAVDLAGDRGLAGFPLLCVTDRQASATHLLSYVHRQLAAGAAQTARADVSLHCVSGASPAAAPDHALELRAYRADGLLNLDWWYDSRRFLPYTVEELAEQFPLALIEMTSDAAVV